MSAQPHPLPAAAEDRPSLHVLGPVSLRSPTSATSPLTQPRPLAVLTYLLLARPRRMHSRDTLIALLWPEVHQEQGRHALRNVLHAIRKSLGNDRLAVRGDGLVGMVPGSVACDALEVEEHVARGEWQAALTLYQGQLLDGFHVSDAPGFEEWLTEERSRLHEMMVTAARALAEQRKRQGDLAGAIRAAERRTRLAPLEEDGHRQLVALLLEHGEPAAARRACDRFAARLQAEFGATPSIQMRHLLEHHVETVAAAPLSAAPEIPVTAARLPEPAVAPSRRRLPLLVGAAALLVLGITFTMRSRPIAPAGESLFVVPIVNATGDTTATWLGPGITISLREQFRRAGWTLVPESRARRIPEGGSALAAARAAGASLLLAGTTDSVDGQVQLRLVATDVATGRSRASSAMLINPGQLLNAEVAAVGALVGQLRPGIAPDSLVAALKRGTDSDAAYRFYLEGTYIWDRRYTAEDMRRAAARFDSAVAHDPAYADALAGRARVWFALGWSGFEPVAAHLVAARTDARRAVELDSTSRMALSTLGAVETVRDSALSRFLFERAIALDPDRADTWFLHGVHHVFLGDFPAAERAFRRVTELDPLSPYPWYTLAGTQVCQGSLDAALATLDRWLAAPSRGELRPSFQYQRGRILLEMGRWQEAVPALIEGLAGEFPETSRAVSMARSAGEVQSALAQGARRFLAAKHGPGVDLGVGSRLAAQMAVIAGRPDEALRILAAARAQGDLGVSMACEDPTLAKVAARQATMSLRGGSKATDAAIP